MINYNMVHVVSLWFLSSLNHRRRKKLSLGGRTILTATVYKQKFGNSIRHIFLLGNKNSSIFLRYTI